jgi:hypothetical protein
MWRRQEGMNSIFAARRPDRQGDFFAPFNCFVLPLQAGKLLLGF